MMGRERYGEEKKQAHNQKHTTSSVKQGGGSVLAWTRIAANRIRSTVFIDYLTADKSIRMNSQVYSAIHFSVSDEKCKTDTTS